VHALSTPDNEMESELWAEGRGPSFCEVYADRARLVSLALNMDSNHSQSGVVIELDTWVKGVLRLVGRFASVNSKRMRSSTLPTSLLGGLDSEGVPLLKLGNGVFMV